MMEAGITPAQCRAARSALGLSQEELAAQAGVSRPVVQDFERGARVPIVNNLRAIKTVMETSGLIFRNEGDSRSTITFVDPDARG